MLRTLAKSIRQYKWLSLISPICVFFEAAFQTLVPYLMAIIIDRGVMVGNLHVIIRWGILLICLALLGLAAGMGASWYSSKAAAGFAKNLRHDLYFHIQTFSFSDIDKFSTSGLVTRLTTDATNLQQAYQMTIRTALRAPLMLIFSVTMAFLVSPNIAWIFVVVIPILAVGLYAIIRSSRKLLTQVFHLYDRLNQVVGENIRGIRVVKIFVRAKTEIQKFQTVAKNIFTVYSKAQRILALNQPLMQLIIGLSTVSVAWLGAKLVVSRQLQIGQLMSLFSYTISILTSLMMLSNVFSQLILAGTSGRRVTAVLDTTTQLHSPANGITTVNDGSISFEHVNFKFNDKEKQNALTDINLQIKSGSTVAVVGSTGSGKSTLVQLIPRLYDVDSGAVKVSGVNVKDYDLTTLRNAAAMVLQNNVLFSGTIKDNLRWGNPNATDEELVQAAKIAQADSFIEQFPDKYNTRIDQTGNNVSGGQRQRISLARSLLKHPKILLLDDATSATDTETEHNIWQAMKANLPETTKVIITQRITSITDADQIIVMENGRVSAIGTHEQLLKDNAEYRSIYQIQIEGAKVNA
ncbi:ABC transporter ATP-binding protein [Lentilactobacillus senioris]|uniref:ABC transporter ATP-binding protein n=1 Tax=Lentilactobacillus senioris TaxID=931534 RepID=UPI003D2A24AE